jgi:hypothetical protein
MRVSIGNWCNTRWIDWRSRPHSWHKADITIVLSDVRFWG